MHLRAISKIIYPVLFLSVALFLNACGLFSGKPDGGLFANSLFALNTVTMPVLSTPRPTKTVEPVASATAKLTAVATQSTVATNKPATTPTSISTATLTATALFIDLSAVDDSKEDFLKLLEDVTIPDGATLKPHQMFVKSWRVKNIGELHWGKETKIALSGTSPFAMPQTTRATFVTCTDTIDFSISSWGTRIHSVAPGESADLALALQAPAEPGEYKITFNLINSLNERITPDFWIYFRVEDPKRGANEIEDNKTNTGITPTPTIVSAEPSYDWTGTWTIRNPFYNNAMETTQAWITQSGTAINGFFYNADGDPVIIQGTIFANGREFRGEFALPWQNRAMGATWRMLANKDQFYSVTDDGAVKMGSVCGGRSGLGLPDACSLPPSD